MWSTDAGHIVLLLVTVQCSVLENDQIIHPIDPWTASVTGPGPSLSIVSDSVSRLCGNGAPCQVVDPDWIHHQ